MRVSQHWSLADPGGHCRGEPSVSVRILSAPVRGRRPLYEILDPPLLVLLDWILELLNGIQV